MKTKVRRLEVYLLLLFMTSCATVVTVDLKRPERKEALPIPEGLIVGGAAKWDITPMPGYPMGGHATAGQTSRGYWTRLYARALYVENQDGDSLVLVSCDLWSMPAGLADRVSEIVRNAPLGKHIGREQIILAATHTHQSPGCFSSNKAYNELAAHRAGFDFDLFSYLAQQIAGAILEASKNASDRASEGRYARLYLGTSEVEKLFRNRSIEAFRLNRDSEAILQSSSLPRGAAPTWAVADDAYKAVDPTITVLRVAPDEDPNQTLGMAVFCAVHPVTMSNWVEVYNADLFGIAATHVERELAKAFLPVENLPVVAVFNGAEGDISADWWPQGRSAADRLGTQLARGIIDAKEKGQWITETGIESRYQISTIANSDFVEVGGSHQQTAKKAMIGVATLGGAEDGRSFFYEAGWIEGVKGSLRGGNEKRMRRLGLQGSKQPALDLRIDPKLVSRFPLNLFIDFENITENLFPIDDVPGAVPIGIYKLGPLAFATLPGEFTFMMGKRIREDLLKNTNAEHAVLVGLTNEYLSYFTTPEEYEAQHYEGASTLYGPAAGPLMRRELNDLGSGSGPVLLPDQARHRRYNTGFGPDSDLRDIGEEPYFHDDGLEELLENRAGGNALRNLPHFIWTDEAPEFRDGVTPRVTIYRQDGSDDSPLLIDGIVEDDQGINFVTVQLRAGEGESQWVVIWLPPGEDQVGDNVPLRFIVTGLRGNPRHAESRPFTLSGYPRLPRSFQKEDPDQHKIGQRDRRREVFDASKPLQRPEVTLINSARMQA